MTPDAPTFTCIVSPDLHAIEDKALVQAGHDPAEFAVLTLGIGGLNIGMTTDPRSGQSAWVFACEAALEGAALTVRQSAILDASGNATSRALAAALPIGGTVRFVVRKTALHRTLIAKIEAATATPEPDGGAE